MTLLITCMHISFLGKGTGFFLFQRELEIFGPIGVERKVDYNLRQQKTFRSCFISFCFFPNFFLTLSLGSFISHIS